MFSLWLCNQGSLLSNNLQVSVIASLTPEGIYSTKTPTEGTATTFSDIKWPGWKALDNILDLVKATSVSHCNTAEANGPWMKSKATSATDFRYFGVIIPVTACRSSGVKIEPGGPGTAMKVERSNSVVSNRQFSTLYLTYSIAGDSPARNSVRTLVIRAGSWYSNPNSEG